MWSMIETVVRQLLPLLPEITVGLRFCTALIWFVLALLMLIRRVRRCMRDARRTQGPAPKATGRG